MCVLASPGVSEADNMYDPSPVSLIHVSYISKSPLESNQRGPWAQRPRPQNKACGNPFQFMGAKQWYTLRLI